MAKTEYFYKKYCKICSKLTDSWKISKQYFDFLKRSPGMKYPEEAPGVVTYDWVCESCAPDYYRDPDWNAPEPFKKVPLPVPKRVTIKPPATSSLASPSAPTPPAPHAPLTSPPTPPAPPARSVVPTRPAPPPRMSAPIPALRVPPVAASAESANPRKDPVVEKSVVEKSTPKFNIPKIKGK